tara:strand:+ start:196 stop:744 length:549 start_codon:yes stop_codon:yes gene_type:complete
MVKNKTYLNVIETLKNLGRQHYFINTTSVGDIFDINLEKSEIFPLMHINPTSVTTGSNQLNYNFQIFVCDLVSEKEDWNDGLSSVGSKNLTNEIDVFNDTLQTCVDIISIFRNSQWQAQSDPATYAGDINAPVYFTDGDYNIEPFTERFDNLLTGWVFSMTVVVQNNFDSCDTPMGEKAIGQ